MAQILAAGPQGLILPGQPRRNSSPLLSQGLVSHWGFDPDSVDFGASIVLDLSNNGNQGTLFAGPTLVSGLTGYAIKVTAAASSYVQTTIGVGLPTGATAPFTICGWVFGSTIVSLSHAFGFGSGPLNGSSSGTGNGTIRGVLQFGGSGDYYFWGVNADWDTGILWDTDSVWHHIGFTADATNIYFYRDGVQRGSATRPAALATAGTEITVGGRHSSASSFFTGSVDDFRIYNRRLDAPEFVTLYQAGYAGLRDAPTQYHELGALKTTGATAYTLTAAVGTFTLTGIAATLTRGYTLTALRGTFTLTGNAVNFATGHSLTASTGTFTLTGVAATFTRGYTLTAARGTFTLTGNAANLVWSSSTPVVTSTGVVGGSKHRGRSKVPSVDAAWPIPGTEAGKPLIQRAKSYAMDLPEVPLAPEPIVQPSVIPAKLADYREPMAPLEPLPDLEPVLAKADKLNTAVKRLKEQARIKKQNDDDDEVVSLLLLSL